MKGQLEYKNLYKRISPTYFLFNIKKEKEIINRFSFLNIYIIFHIYTKRHLKYAARAFPCYSVPTKMFTNNIARLHFLQISLRFFFCCSFWFWFSMRTMFTFPMSQVILTSIKCPVWQYTLFLWVMGFDQRSAFLRIWRPGSRCDFSQCMNSELCKQLT